MLLSLKSKQLMISMNSCRTHIAKTFWFDKQMYIVILESWDLKVFLLLMENVDYKNC